jgi:hypothetical protein
MLNSIRLGACRMSLLKWGVYDTQSNAVCGWLGERWVQAKKVGDATSTTTRTPPGSPPGNPASMD